MQSSEHSSLSTALVARGGLFPTHMRPIDADRVYTSTGQVALTILLQNGDPMLIVELTRL